MSHPLMELRFELDGVQVIRFWYHVPRIGDAISLHDIQGYVEMVTWMEEWATISLGKGDV